MPTTTSGFYYPDTSSSMSFESQMAQAATSQQSVIDDLVLGKRQEQTFKWATSDQRLAQVGMTEGDMGFQRDNDSMWYYNGSQWVIINKAGTSRVVPTSVGGAGVSFNTDTGSVSFSASTSVEINGIFNSSFSSYRIEFAATTSAATEVGMRLRVAGVDAATDYDRQRLSGIGATAAASQNLAQTSWGLIAAGVIGQHRVSIDLDSPAVATSTFGHASGNSSNNPMTGTGAGVHVLTLLHRTATAYDGFRLIPASGNISGTVRVYGYA